jgi:hypothetical protein
MCGTRASHMLGECSTMEPHPQTHCGLFCTKSGFFLAGGGGLF